MVFVTDVQFLWYGDKRIRNLIFGRGLFGMGKLSRIRTEHFTGVVRYIKHVPLQYLQTG
jgi:hypothetical protein